MNRYLIVLMRRPPLDPAVVPLHLAFLEALRQRGQVELSGPFGDESGGAYLLRAETLDDALAMVHDDPAYRSGGWDITVHEWLAR
jgi:uncharacterized protein YciI